MNLEKDKFNKAYNLLMDGRRKEASAELLSLYKITNNNTLKLKIIDSLLSALDPTDELNKLMSLTEDGIEISKKMNLLNLQAHFMAKKAENLMFVISMMQYDKHNLKLSSDWIEFATELDKKMFEEYENQENKLESEANALISDAIDIVNKTENKKTRAYILTIKGSISGGRYLQLKSEYLKTRPKIKWWLKIKFMRWPFLEKLFILSKDQSEKLQSLMNDFIKNYLSAAKIFEEINDSTAGYAYYNLANNLKIAYRFKLASKYLEKAELIAQTNQDGLLIKQVAIMKKSIRAKNEDIPNYINGERRPDK